MREVHLYVNYFESQNAARAHELIGCVYKNAIVFDRIHILCPQADYDVGIFSQLKNFVWVQCEERPSVQTYIECANTMSRDTVVVIANLDIAFTAGAINKLRSFPWTDGKYFMGLARYDMTPEGIPVLLSRRDAQDSFIWFGPCDIQEANCPLGVPGGDNSLLRRAKEAAYIVINPAKSIKTIHHHLVQGHTYRDENNNVRLDHVCPEPYFFCEPHELEPHPFG